MRYMRKLITKDGIESPLESVSTDDAEREKICTMLHERTTYDALGSSCVRECREYKLVRHEQFIVLTYREV